MIIYSLPDTFWFNQSEFTEQWFKDNIKSISSSFNSLSIDNLKGFAETISTVFVQTEVQSCIVHQIRNSLKYVASKDQKVFMADLKPVYQTINKTEAEEKLEGLSEKWNKKYPVAIESWRRNWERLATYFKYPDDIRKLVYTTNPI
jgi:putative transposase